MRNPYFNDTLAVMAQLHDRKNHDYAEDDNPFSNFEMAAQYAGVSVQTVFNVLLGVKQARIAELEAKIANGDMPLHESLDDSRLDRAVYAALAVAYSRRRDHISKTAQAVAAEDISALHGIPTPGSEWDEYLYPTKMVAGKTYGYDFDRNAFTVTPVPPPMTEDEKDFLNTYGWLPDSWPCPHGQPCECVNPTEADIHEERVTRAEFYALEDSGCALAAQGEGG